MTAGIFGRVLRSILVLALVVAVAACGNDDESDADGGAASGPTTTEGTGGSDEATGDGGLDALIAAAQEEGQLVWYCAPTENVCQAIGEAFAEEYDINQQFVRLSSTDLHPRYLAEADAGAVAADMILTVNSGFLDDALADGLIVPFDEAGIPDFPGDFPEDFILDERGTVIAQILPNGIAYNTDRVSPDEAPQDWEDLLDPRWRGEILLTDPNISDTYIQFWHLLLEELGEDFLAGLGEQDFKVVPAGAAGAQALGAGEGSINVNALGAVIDGAASTGAPVAFVQPDLTTGVEISPAISADAAHPNAARLFAHFIMSEEGSAILNDFPGAASPYGGGDAPGDYRSPSPDAIEQRDRILELLGL